MPYEPKHSLSECLKRRHRTLTRFMDGGKANHDDLIEATQEAFSIEYWLRITEEAEREERLRLLNQQVINQVQAYQERAMK
jgi:hypothetical protein